MSTLKNVLKRLVPQKVLDMRRRKAVEGLEASYAGMTNQEVFSAIYNNAEWGQGANQAFFSGTGSHDKDIILPYIASVRKVIDSFASPPVVVDLGCGDFNVGAKIRPHCKEYIACDVVPGLIDQNTSLHGGDFRCIDITSDPIPSGDLVCIRQVLQHIDNQSILRVVSRISKFRNIILTEHVPVGKFSANKDKPVGKGIRLGIDSGVVLTEPPFSLSGYSESVICDVPDGIGTIRTWLYQR